MPIPNPSPKAPISGTPIVGMDTKKQFYKSINAAGQREFKDDAGNVFSDDEFRKLNPSGYTEGVASNSELKTIGGGTLSAGVETIVPDKYSGGPSKVHDSGAGLGSVRGATQAPTAAPPPPPVPDKTSDMGMMGGMGGEMGGMGGSGSNPILDGLASALQFRRPFMG